MKRLVFSLTLVTFYLTEVLGATSTAVNTKAVDPKIIASNYLGLVSFLNDSNQGNVLIPLDPLFRGLTLLGVGSRGKTQAQILKLLGADSIENLFNYYKEGEYGKGIHREDRKFLAAISWETHRPYEKFSDFSSKNFSIPFLLGNYDSINNWAVEETNRGVSDIVDVYPLGSSYLMYFVGSYRPFIFTSSVYTDSGSFVSDNGPAHTVDFFSFNANLHYVSDGYAQTIFVKDHAGLNLVALVLPNVDSPPKFKNSVFSLKYLLDLFENYNISSARELDISIPKVSFVSKGTLKNSLKRQGITLGFDNSNARFPLVSSGDLYFSDILYHFRFSLIPPASLIEFGPTPVKEGAVFSPLKVTFNRPFYIVSINNDTGLPDIVVKVDNPSK